MTRVSDGSEIYWDAAQYDAFNAPVESDLKFYLAAARAARGPVLELACGTGRLTLPIARAGVDITGLDLAAPMLAQARRRAAAEGLNIKFLRGDAAKFRADRKCKLIFIAFNSLQHLGRRGQIEGFFASARRALAPGGRLLLDVFNPEPLCLVRDPEEALPVAYYDDPAGGGKMLVNELYSYDKAAQTARITWVYRRERDGHTLKKRLNLRCFFPEELLALAHYNGFKGLARYGSFKKAAFKSGSKKQILLLAPRGPL